MILLFCTLNILCVMIFENFTLFYVLGILVEIIDWIVWKECFFKSELCRTHKRSRQKQGSLVNNLDVSCKEYLICSKTIHCYNKDQELSEKQSIESCRDVNFASYNYLCAYHRYIYGTYRKPPKNCLFPEHQKTTSISSYNNKTI